MSITPLTMRTLVKKWLTRGKIRNWLQSLFVARRCFQLLKKAGIPLIEFSYSIIGSFFSAALEIATVGLLIPISESIVQSNWNPHELKIRENIVIPIPNALSASPTKLFMVLILTYLSLFLAKKVIDFYTTVNINKKTLQAGVSLKTALVGNAIRFGKAYFDKTSPAWVVEVISGQTQNLSYFLPQVVTIANSAVYAVAYALVMLKISVPLSLLVVFLLPWISLLTEKIRVRIQSISGRANRKAQQANVLVTDTLSCLPLVKANNREHEEVSNMTGHFQEMFEYQFIAAKKGAVLPVVQEVAGVSLIIALLSCANLLAVHFHTPKGTQYLLFLYVLRRAVQSLNQVGGGFAVFSNVSGNLEAIEEIMDLSDKGIISDGPKELTSFDKNIEFRNLNFSFQGRNETLKNVSLIFEKGKMTALVGHSGAGKSTIIQLIQRLYNVPAGTIFIDGRDIRDFSLKSIRSLIATVSQDNLLFNNTIRFNLNYGHSVSLSDKETMAILESVVLDQMVRQLPHGLDTQIGDRGVQLSGGEKQRLSLARAFIRKAPIVLLDEATSSLDVKTEQAISHAIEKLSERQTVILVAHRLSTIMKADKIIVLEKGRVVESGTIEELLRLRGYFYEMYNTQSFAA